MSIAAADLVHPQHLQGVPEEGGHPHQEAQVAKITSLVVKVGAVAAIRFIDPQFSIDVQSIGGVIILQTLPAVALGLFTRWFHRGGLIAGWFAGMAAGIWMLYNIPRLGPDGARPPRPAGLRASGDRRATHLIGPRTSVGGTGAPGRLAA
jgi:SSS family solute:Na+ symporter